MQLIRFLEKYPIPSIVCFVIITTAPWLNEVTVSLMEARNFITAREMLTKGNWILTTLNELPRYEKPPLPTWLTAFSGYVFGIENTWALRLPAIGMLIFLGIYVYLFSLQFADKEHSFRNALIALTSFYVLAILIEAPWDIYSHAFMLMAIVHLLRSYTSNQNKDTVLATIFIACSVLSKGPVSLYALLLPFIIAYPLSYGMKHNFLLKTLIPILAGILAGSVWFVYVRMADPNTFIKIAAKEVTNWSGYQVKPFYYYWSFFAQSGPWLILSFVGLLYPYLKKKVANPKAYKLSFLWTLFSLVLLSLVPEKKMRFLMPVLIPLAINTGFYVQYLIKAFTRFKRITETIPLYLNYGLLGILSVVLPVIAFFFFQKEINLMLLNYLVAALLLLTIGSLLLFILHKKNILMAFYSSILLYAVIMTFLIPVLARNQNQNEAFAPITALREEAEKQNIEVYVLDEISPEMLWDYGNSIPFVAREDSSYNFPARKSFGLLVNNKDNLLKSNAHNLFEIQEVATFNRNVLKQSARRHRPRNISYYYILTAKEQK